MTVSILNGDCRDVLKTLEAESFDCMVTSPPYYGLRDYGCEGQIGLESTLDAYVEKLCAVFDEIWRVLKPTGTAWLNLGDSYAATMGGGGNNPSSKSTLTTNGGRGPLPGDKYSADMKTQARRISTGLKSKDLCGVPWRVAFALQARGWYLRSAVVWHKPNPMPESVRDRPTSAYEMVFLLTKGERYFYDADAIAEQVVRGAAGSSFHEGKTGAHQLGRSSTAKRVESETRNARNVWTIAPKPDRRVYYDFQSADYVDDHGIPRKLSPDCPVHGQPSQLQTESPEDVSCGERQDLPSQSIPHSGNRRDLGLQDADDSIANCKTSPAADTTQTQTLQSMIENKTYEILLDAEVDGTLFDSSDTQLLLAPSTKDYFPPEGYEIATPNSSQSRRMVPDLSSVQHDLAFDQTTCRIQRTSQQSDSFEQTHARSHESKIEESLPDEHVTLNALFEQPSRTSRKQSGKSSIVDKCSCKISQVAHFATMPPDLAERCIKAGCPERVCSACGAPWTRETDRESISLRPNSDSIRGSSPSHGRAGAPQRGSMAVKVTDHGIRPACRCDAVFAPGSVLDPFGGAGTTGLVADRLGRHATLIELNPAYGEMAKERIFDDFPVLPLVQTVA